MSQVPAPIRVAVCTGSRAEFGLLVSTLKAIREHPGLELQLCVTGTHLLPEVGSIEEIRGHFEITAMIEMQQAGVLPSRAADVQALSRGIAGFGATFEEFNPEVVLLLGDRLEAFAAATAASIGGRLTAHLHGGDRAEGVADEAIRHAITKLAQLHFPATRQSAARVQSLGENPRFIHCVGSPAVDGLTTIPPATDAELQAFELSPAQAFAVVLQHPGGFADEIEEATMSALLAALHRRTALPQFVIFAPNHDPGRSGILNAIKQYTDRTTKLVITNRPRPQWIGLLKRAAVIVGNSSAGLIESAVLGLPCVNIGPRQAGREQAANVINVPGEQINPQQIVAGLTAARSLTPPFSHPYGAGTTGEQVAAILAKIRQTPPPLRKRNHY